MQHPSVVIGVENVRAAMPRVIAAGGQVLGQPMSIPGVGDYVSFVDTEGNRNSIIQPCCRRSPDRHTEPRFPCDS